jgi:hypothetical protein
VVTPKGCLGSIRTGNRPVTLDGFPHLGETKSYLGLYILTGTYRDGFLQAPYLAKNAAVEILEHTRVFNEAFVPERLPIVTFSLQEAAHEYQKHYVAGIFEHRTNVPKFIGDRRFLQNVAKNIRELCDEYKFPMGLSPDLLFMLEMNEFSPEQVESFFPSFAADAADLDNVA